MPEGCSLLQFCRSSSYVAYCHYLGKVPRCTYIAHMLMLISYAIYRSRLPFADPCVVPAPLFPHCCAICSYQHTCRSRCVIYLFIHLCCLPCIADRCGWSQQGSKSNAAEESREERPGKKAKFDGGYASTMQGAEAFFNKPSPFQKAAEEKEKAAAAAAAGVASDGESVDARVLDAVDSAETAAETTGTVVAVGRLVCCDT